MDSVPRHDLTSLELIQLTEALRMARLAAIDNFRVFMKSEGHSLDALDDDSVWSLGEKFTVAMFMYGLGREDAVAMVVDMLKRAKDDQNQPR